MWEQRIWEISVPSSQFCCECKTALENKVLVNKSANTLNHSNTVTAKTTQALRKTAFDAQGHITGSSELSTAESNAIGSGIDSTKVAQIQTNKNSIDGQQNATSSGGNGYALINNIRLYVASSAPTGNIPDGSVGVGW